MRAGGMIGLGVLGIEPTRAWAQSILKSLEEGGTDNDVRARKNIWTDGGAGALTSNITFPNEIAQVFDDGRRRDHAIRHARIFPDPAQDRQSPCRSPRCTFRRAPKRRATFGREY
jgi:hypothetical protein